MKNNIAFSILDMYQKEAFLLYNSLRSFTNYPTIIQQDEYDDIDGKMYSIAFAYLMQDYLYATERMYKFDEWEELVFTMQLEEDKEIILAENPIENDDDYTSHLWDLKQLYRKTIIKDIKKLYPDNILLAKFFSGIYYLANDNHLPELNLETLSFMDDL